MESSEHNGAYITPPIRTTMPILCKRTFFTRPFLKMPSYSLISEISDIISLLCCLVIMSPFTVEGGVLTPAMAHLRYIKILT